jgi:hypothetical protein
MQKRKYKFMQGEPNYKGKFYMTLDANIRELSKLSKRVLSKILTAGFNGSCIKFLDVPSNKIKFLIDCPLVGKYNGEFISTRRDSHTGYTIAVGELCWEVAKAFKKIYSMTKGNKVPMDKLDIEAIVWDPKKEYFTIKVGSPRRGNLHP